MLFRYLKRANLGSHASSDGSAWSRNDAGGLLQVIDQTCSAGTTYAGLNHVYDDYNYNFKQTLDIDGDDVFDDPTTKAMTWRIIPFLKKVRVVKILQVIKITPSLFKYHCRQPIIVETLSLDVFLTENRSTVVQFSRNGSLSGVALACSTVSQDQ